MARIIFGTYLFRYPLGGSVFTKLQYILGLRRCGHDVYVVEKAGYPDAFFDPVRRVMSDDCRQNIKILLPLIEEIGLDARWCLADISGNYFGMSRARVEKLFKSADAFIDYGSHGSWGEEATGCASKVLIDGEPGFRQIRMEQQRAKGVAVTTYDHYFTVGRNVGTPGCAAPTVGLPWKPSFHPVAVDLIQETPACRPVVFTTVMNWQAHSEVVHSGVSYGQKNRSFDRFRQLPRLTSIPIELALAGRDAPRDLLLRDGWRVRDAHAVTHSVSSYLQYISASAGEFAFAKEIFVALNTGWFSDRSGAYLAAARPVVLEETGFSAHLPTGEGLFGVSSAEEAASALECISSDYERHSRRAREIAVEYLDARKVMQEILEASGIS